MRLVYSAMKMGLPFTSHGSLVYLMVWYKVHKSIPYHFCYEFYLKILAKKSSFDGNAMPYSRDFKKNGNKHEKYNEASFVK